MVVNGRQQGKGRRAGKGAPDAGKTPVPSRTRKRHDDKPAAAPSLPIVGIGASAGGLEAFSELLEHLATDTGMAFVLIPHLAPGQSSLLPELLAKKTSMPVLPAADGLVLEPDHIYVLPPDNDVILFRDRLNLVERTKVSGLHLPIDYFFRSLAVEAGRRAIAIVLSGAASDGAQGLAAVKAEGGITIAQDPASARYDGMPRSAIAAGCVDMVFTPAGIAAELARLGKHPYLVEEAPKAGPNDELSQFAKIFVVLNSVFGVDFSDYKLPTIRRRVERRMALYRLGSLEEYVDYLTAHPGEIESLYQDILIMVTDFFREPEAFAALRSRVLPHLLADKPAGATVRVWVPGCASGEEAYSVCIEVAEHLRLNDLRHPVKLFATDINEREIARARTATYQPSRLGNVAPAYLERYFSRGESGYEVKKEIRDLCVFARHDVTRDAPFSHIDLISCRNLLIYLGNALQERVLPMFHFALRPGGVLMLGSAESVGSASDLFAVLDRKHKLFARRQTPTRLPLEFAYPSSASIGGLGVVSRTAVPNRAGADRQGFDSVRMADSLIMSEHTPAGVVIDGAFSILQFRGSTDAFLANAPGTPSFDLLSMAREGLAADLRQAVEEARATGRRSARRSVPVRGTERQFNADVVVHPLMGAAGELHFLVLLQPSSRELKLPGEAEPSADADSEMVLLRSELDASREHLQALIAEKDLVVEELRGANEEIQSSNEELQSINEELETAKEELQSTNEELRTVNEELESRNLQLITANDDLSSLLTGIRLPIVMVDRELRLRRFTPEAGGVISITATDVGRPIGDFTFRFDMPDLEGVLREVIETVVPFQRDVLGTDGRWSSLRVRPFQTSDNRIEGAILTLFDIDELHRSLERVSDAARFSDGLRRIGALVRDARSRPRPLGGALDEAARAEGADSASLMLREGGVWRTGFGYRLKDQDIGLTFDDAAFPHAALALAARSSVAISHVAEDDRVDLEVVRQLRLRSVLVAPVFSDAEVAAVLVFNWHSAPIKLSDGQIDFAEKAAVLFGLVMEADGRGGATG